MRSFARPLTLSLAASAVGAALAYFLDPSAGRRRRHTTRDRGLKVARRGASRGRRFARHTSAEAVGRVRRVAHALPLSREEPDDVTLAHKVESILFRDRDVPKGQININAEEGVVFLRGQVDRPELVGELGARVRAVKGVRAVENLLHLPASPPGPGQ
jgi:osmotically-inducible protein OsmY